VLEKAGIHEPVRVPELLGIRAAALFGARKGFRVRSREGRSVFLDPRWAEESLLETVGWNRRVLLEKDAIG
jgi:hypothetical protein